MAKYDNTNRVALWKRERDNDNYYYSGIVNIDGEEYNMTLFVNEDDDGRRPVLSGSVRPKDNDR